MNHASWLVIGLLVVPVAGAGSGTLAIGPEHSHQEYIVPYNVLLGGIGGGLFEGSIMVYADYDAVRPDDDASGSDNVTSHVTINAYAPGSNVATVVLNSTLAWTDCTEAVKVQESGGGETEVSWYTVVYELRLTDGTAESCTAQIAVQNTGQSPFQVIIQASAYNNDGDPTQGNPIALLAWVLWVVYFAFTVRIHHPAMRVLAAFIGYSILLLPLSIDQETLFLVAQSLVFLYTVFRWTGDLP